jgi:hypothetical protein
MPEPFPSLSQPPSVYAIEIHRAESNKQIMAVSVNLHHCPSKLPLQLNLTQGCSLKLYQHLERANSSIYSTSLNLMDMRRHLPAKVTVMICDLCQMHCSTCAATLQIEKIKSCSSQAGHKGQSTAHHLPLYHVWPLGQVQSRGHTAAHVAANRV